MDRKAASQGYVLFDVLLALFLFSLGFGALFGLYEGAARESQHAANLLEAANVAQKRMDQLAIHPWRDNLAQQLCIPGGIVEGSEGRFTWQIRSEWDVNPQLLKVNVEVIWTEKGKASHYSLESLYAVE